MDRDIAAAASNEPRAPPAKASPRSTRARARKRDGGRVLPAAAAWEIAPACARLASPSLPFAGGITLSKTLSPGVSERLSERPVVLGKTTRADLTAALGAPLLRASDTAPTSSSALDVLSYSEPAGLTIHHGAPARSSWARTSDRPSRGSGRRRSRRSAGPRAASRRRWSTCPRSWAPSPSRTSSRSTARSPRSRARPGHPPHERPTTPALRGPASRTRGGARSRVAQTSIVFRPSSGHITTPTRSWCTPNGVSR